MRPLREALDFRHDALDREGRFDEEDEEAIEAYYRQREREVNYQVRARALTGAACRNVCSS